jgi:sugar O-acyltransferase (sialic acid O-acetyltransferase NeuD family)
VTTPLVILGAGGLGREVHDLVEAINDAGGDWSFLGFIDPDPSHPELLDDRGPLLGGDEVLGTLDAATRFVVAIGDNTERRGVAERAEAAGLVAAVLVHPRALVGKRRVELGPGTIIAAGAAITTNVVIGRHCRIDQNATVAHDCRLGDFVAVSPGANLSGAVKAGDGVLIGTNAAVVQGHAIGAGAIVGAGAVVVRDVAAGDTVAGVPASPLGRRS